MYYQKITQNIFRLFLFLKLYNIMFTIKKTLVSGLLVSCIILAGCASKTTDSTALVWVAECVTNAGAVFYGTEWCPHCKNQKALFGEEAMKKVKSIDCDEQKALCTSANITGYPTWVFRDGTNIGGTQTLEAIGAKTNCELPGTGTGS